MGAELGFQCKRRLKYGFSVGFITRYRFFLALATTAYVTVLESPLEERRFTHVQINGLILTNLT